MASKFKNYQEVIIPNFMCNGTRMDIGARIEENGDWPRHPGKCLVVINTVRFLLLESQIIDASEYWSERRKRENNG